MVLSADWSTRAFESSSNVPNRLVTSHSNGMLCVWDVSDTCGLTKISSWSGHVCYGAPIEAWIAAFDCYNPNVIWSGGDDSKLKGWDTRTHSHTPVFVNSHHTMGVCSIQFSLHHAGRVVTGSYDDSVCVWDVRSMTRTSEPVSSVMAGGGVWRIKEHPSNPDLLAIAAMYNGFHVLSGMNDSSLANILTQHSYYRQQSIAYGIDWAGEHSIASASFYDHSLHLWDCC
eukprot:c15274_g1_i1.p1 GENE.c15274_g1_i1~~c15274_g1_i1.p1  ORF type:complete len:228 (-),score=40.21 c15274_g1_i1:111-794(-)